MKLLKILMSWIALSFIFTNVLHAEDVEIDISPTEPVKNESFFVTFRIRNSGGDAPIINFIPSGAKILGKREEGVSISTVVINGKFTTTREQNYVYELVSSQPNLVILRNITIDLGGKTLKHQDVHISIRDMPKRIPEAFMEAEVSKTRVFIGEGIDVNYYLYFKTSISANDVKDFPKLNKFIKRFHHVNAPVETVQYHGEVIKRILAYSARIYPEKAGPATIDPMTISVQVIQTDYNSPFGGFGLGTQRYKNVDLSSKSLAIEVLPLPSENVPPGFTGLVGEHEFIFTPGKDKYLVNEPIELKLEVKGKGALEKMEAPVLYSENGLEQFDTKGEVSETGNSSAKKVFEYTYLARSAVNLKEHEVSLAYFDPNTGKYIDKKIKVPSIIVSGVVPVAASGGNGSTVKKTDELNIGNGGEDFLTRWFNRSSGSSNKAPAVKAPLGLVSPDFSQGRNLFTRWIDIANIAVILAMLCFFAWWYKSAKDSDELSLTQHYELKKYMTRLKKNGINYSDLYQVLSALDKDNMLTKGGVSIGQVIAGSAISPEGKEYFKKALEFSESKSFGKEKMSSNVVFEPKYFNELLKKI